MKRQVHILPPDEFLDLKHKQPKKAAAGIPSIISSMKHISEELGMVNAVSLLSKMNQKDGFDCPGCAWPDPQDRSGLGEFCENGVKAIVEEGTRRKVDPDFFSRYSVEEMSSWSDYKIGKSGRITHPMYLAKGSSYYEPISWEEAFEKITNKLKSLDSPNKAIFYTSGRTSNEAAFLYQLLVRQFGTNNLPDCSNMCHESSGKGLSETLGIGKGSVTLEDLYEAEVIMLMGQNPGTNHPRMLLALEKCKNNGGKIININPMPETGSSVFVNPKNPFSILKGGTRLSDHFLQVKVNGDVALLKALMILLLEKEEKNPGSVFDHEFIKEHTEGYDSLIAELRSTNLDKAIMDSGVDRNQVEELAELLAQKKKIIICWAMGLTQHENGVQNIREIVNLLLLKGSIGKPGAGTCPVRGHSNVQGDRTVGIWEAPPQKFLDSLERNFGIQMPREHGYDAVNSIHAMHEGKVKVFFSLGGNFISATPDSELTGKAMQNCELTVQVSTKLNRSHLVTGDEALILPCISRSEEDIQAAGPQFVSVENSMGIVHKSMGKRTPASEQLLSEPAIIAGLGHVLFGDEPISWKAMKEDYDLIRDKIEATIPGFEQYNERVREAGGFYLPNGAREKKFNTMDGKARFTVNPLPERSVGEGRFILTTIRTHDQYNTTIYGNDDRYRGIHNERRVVLMNPLDMNEAGLKEEEVVDLISHYKGRTRTASQFKIVPYDISRGCVASYFPETNVLVPIDSVAEKSNTPASKFIDVEIRKLYN